MGPKGFKSISGALVLVMLTVAAGLAAVPRTINYQGYIKDGSGVPVSAATSVRFSLYSSNPARNNPVWSETKSVTPANGIYSTQLGSSNPIAAPFDVPYYLGLKVEGDDEMPLQPFSSVPYALRAGSVETVPCNPGDSLACYDGPESTKNVGICLGGIRSCTPDGTFGACAGEVMPMAEICWNGIDEDCDGQLDNGCPLISLGQSCSAGNQCQSGYCTDGVCCSTACSGTCESCSSGTCVPISAGLDPANECTGTGTCGGVCNGLRACQYPANTTSCGTCARCNGAGSCVFVPADTDPDNNCPSCQTCNGSGACKNVANGIDTHNDCPDQGPCGLDGYCNGSGACRYYGNSTVYAPASCNAGTNIYSFPDLCNGAGGVTDGGTASCAPLTCSGTACRTSCTQQSDCATGYFCDLGDSDVDGNTSECLPKKSNGSACSNDANDFECSGGYCNNGFCCSSSTGLCCATASNCSSLEQPAICSPYATCLPKKTVATCSASNVCQTALMDDPAACSGQTCSDGTCTGSGNLTWTPKSTCNSGICTPTGSPVSCDDGNVCTNDVCTPATGCSHTNNNTPTLSCYKDTLGNPLSGTPGVGICTNGTQQCSNGSWGPCLGAVGASSEICGTSPARDENCNGQTNEQGAIGCTTYRLDNDQDGHGISSSTRCYCTPGLAYLGAAPDAYTAVNSGINDCDDNNSLAFPGNTEKCSTAYDDNCNGSSNEDNAIGCVVRFLDNDRDGYGTSSARCLCTPAIPYDSQYSTDCNDSNAAIMPGATEVCNGIDDNCSGTVDTAEIPIGTLCPTPANSTGSTCVASPTVTCRAVCDTYWWDVDGSFSNGCEVQEDSYDRSGVGDSCSGAWIGTVNEYLYGTPYFYYVTGNILPAGDVDWYYVYAADSSGNGTVDFDVRFNSNPGGVYRYDLYQGSCSNLVASAQTGINKGTVTGYYYLRVYRTSGVSPAGETYTIMFSNNYW